MEWVDDVVMFMRKGGGSPRAYQMAAPLLADIATSLQVTSVLSPSQADRALLVVHLLLVSLCVTRDGSAGCMAIVSERLSLF